MAFPNNVSKFFRIYVTHLDGDGHFLKISGQLDTQVSLMVESYFESARENLEQSMAPGPAFIHEGIICAAKDKHGKYYRAKVIDISNLAASLVRVYFIDFGNSDTISLSTIRLLDEYDPMLMQLQGQASNFYLSSVMQPSGIWEEPLLLKLQSLLCYSEYPAILEAQTRIMPLISVQFKGMNLSKYLVSNGFGIAVPLQKQEALLLQDSGVYQHVPDWQQNYVTESPCTEHVQFLTDQNFFVNPAWAMRLQQNMSLPSNSSVPPPSMVSQRLLVNKVPQAPVNLEAPGDQPQSSSVVVLETPPSMPPSAPVTAAVEATEPPSPKKFITYKNQFLEVNSQHQVFVSFAEEGPELFAVQLITDGKKLHDMMDDLNRRLLSSLAEPPTIGTVCLCRMPGDRIICRAIVMDLSGSQCKLFFVDFGDTEMVSYYDIFDIPEEFVIPNMFAMRFCLSGIKNLEKGPYLNEAFKQLVNGKVLTLRVVSPEGPPLIQYVELYYDNKNVLDLLLANMNDKLQFNWMEMLPLGSKQSVYVSYVDSCIKFYAQLSDKIDELKAVMDAVKVHCESSSSPGILPTGAACCARFPDDGNWYRARIGHINGNKVTVAYVDYGNEREVEVSDLRPITPELIKLPVQALKFALKGFENKPVKTETSNQLEMLVLEETLMAEIVGVMSNDTLVVSLVDDTVSPPLDVTRRITQPSQPRSNIKHKVTPRVRKEPPENFSSLEGSKDSSMKCFRGEKSSKDECYSPRDGTEDFESSIRGGSKPWQNKAAGIVPPAGDEWESPRAAPAPRPAFHPPSSQSRDNNRDSDTKLNQQDEWKKKKDDWDSKNSRDNCHVRGDYRGDRRDNRGDRDNWCDNKGNFQNFRENREKGDRVKSNFTPSYRADKSFGSDGDKKPDRSNRSQDYKGRGKFTQIQYRKLTDPVTLETQFVEPMLEMGAKHEVSVTWITSPDNFYTQVLSLQPKFLEMMHRIPELYKGVKSYTGNIPVGGSVLARYPADGVLYRATVLSVRRYWKLLVQYVDFGNKELIHAKDIWQLDRQLMELPKMAVHCSLLGVSPKVGVWKAGPDIDLCFNAPSYQSVFQECVDGQWKVSLWNDGVGVADLLVEKQLAARLDQQSSAALKDEPIDLSIVVGQQIMCKVTHVESFEKFYVQLDLDKAALVESSIGEFDTSKLTRLGADGLTDGIHCIVKHEDNIYRAILNDVSDAENIQAVLPDYGISITTNLANLMPLPAALGEYYYQSLECLLNNYTAESNQLMTLEELKSRLVGNKFIIYINDVEGVSLVSTLYDAGTGRKVCVLHPDEGAHDAVAPLCARAVLGRSLGAAFVTHASSLDHVYLQKADDADRLAGLLEDLYNFYEEETRETLSSFEADSLCAAKSSDSNWYRAEIVSVQDTDVTVQFSDYGNTETVPKESLRKLDEKFFEPCALALDASLGLQALHDDALTKLIEWTTDKEIQVTLAFGTDGWLASLHLDGVDLATKLVNEKLATPQVSSIEETKDDQKLATPQMSSNEETKQDVKLATPQMSCNEETKEETPVVEPISPPAGCAQVYISHFDTPGHFWLQRVDNGDKIDKIEADLQTNAATYADIENRELGTLCIAKYLADDQWYRAEIIDSNSDSTTVQYIDYGNTDVLDNQPGLIKTMPDHLKGVERYALKSRVNAVPRGSSEWSEPASDCFTQLVGDLSAAVDALFLKDYVDIFVDGQNLTDKLVSEGYAVRSEETERVGDLPPCSVSRTNSPSDVWIQLETATHELQAMETAMANVENFPELREKEEGMFAAKYPEGGNIKYEMEHKVTDDDEMYSELNTSQPGLNSTQKDTSDTLDNTNDTFKTAKQDDSKDSLNSDMGYMSCGDHDKSPIKDAIKLLVNESVYPNMESKSPVQAKETHQNNGEIGDREGLPKISPVSMELEKETKM